MSLPCMHCASLSTLNLNTAQRIGVMGSTLVGSAIGAWRASTMSGSLSIAVARFPPAKLPAAMMGAVTFSQVGSRIATSLFEQWLPVGDGTPWLCLACGHTFRQSYPPLAAAH